jgi:tellurite resistance protein TerA
MNRSIQPGENITLGALQGTVFVTHKVSQEEETSLTAFLLTDKNTVLGDEGVVFYNQPEGPEGMAVYYPPQDEAGVRTHRINFDLAKAPSGIVKIAVTLTEDQGAGFIKVQNLKASVHVGSDTIELTPAQFSTEKGIVVLELYLRNSQPKIKAVWQGFSAGLDGLCRHFGVEVNNQETAAKDGESKLCPDAPKASKPKDTPVTDDPPKVNLQKVIGKVNISKGQKPIIIDKTPEITAQVTWDSRTDYDIYALVLTKEGRQVDVAMFGATGIPPLQNFANGTVEHMGDVGNSGGGFFSSRNKNKSTEIIKIRPNDNVLAVVPVVYSAQSNGCGSFFRYRVSMTIDNNQGTQISISSENANNNDCIYTCVPGLILNTPDGIVIDPVEMYSEPSSECRPKLEMSQDGKIKILMDAGPVNDYK